MIILLEGSDCVGKTTLANACADALTAAGKTVVRRKNGTPKHPDPLVEYLVPLHDHDGTEPWIIDRAHLGELVYGPILRGGSRLTLPQAHYIELVLTRLGTANIHVSASQTVHKERFDVRGDAVVTWAQAAQAWLAFNVLRAEFSHYVTIHTDSYPLSRNVMDILRRLELEHEFHQDLPTTYIGPSRPRVLLLGDKQGSTRPGRPELRWPFVPWRDTSGHWLLEAMLAAGIHPAWDVGLVNACERGSEALSDLYKQLDAPFVVALGVNARNAATEAGLPLTAHMSHPQHARRFHNKSQAEYGQRIKESMR